MGRAWRLHARSYVNQGHLDRAISLLEWSLAIHRAWHITGWLQGTTASLGYAYALTGRLAEALPLLEEAVAADISMAGSAHPIRLRWLGHALLLTGRPGQALDQVQQALDLARQQKQPGEVAWNLRLLGEMAMERDPPDVDDAEARSREALGLAESLGMRPLAARCHLGLGRLLGRTGTRRAAADHLETARTMFREMDMGRWLTQAEATLRAVGSSATAP